MLQLKFELLPLTASRCCSSLGWAQDHASRHWEQNRSGPIDQQNFCRNMFQNDFLDSQTCHVRKNSPHPCSNAEFSFYKTMRCRQTFSAMNVAGPGHHTDSHFTRLCMWSVHSEHSHIPVSPMGCVQFHNSISLVIFSKRFLWMKSGCRGFRSNDLSRSHFLLFMSPTLAFQWWCVHLIFMAPH